MLLKSWALQNGDYQMKTLVTALLSSVCFAAISANCGYAADVYGGQSYKDKPVEVFADPAMNRGGFYITGHIGAASGDRDINRNINRGVDLGLDVTGIDPADVTDAQADLAAVGIPSTLDGNTLTLPLIGDVLGINDSDSFNSAVFGGGLSYLWHRPDNAIGFSVGINIDGYGDNETVTGHANETGVFTGGTALADFNFGGGANCTLLATCAGQPAVLFGVPLTQSGALAFERDFDIDLPIKLHWFATNRLAFNIGAGPSWARGSLKSSNGPTDPISGAINGVLPGFSGGLTTNINDEDTSLGYVLTGGLQYWATDRLVLGVQGDWKQHTFEFDAASSNTATLGGPISLTSRSREHIEVEDSTFSVKGTVSYKLN